MTSCFNCGGKGHIAGACPTRQINIVMPNDDMENVEKVEGDTEDAEKEPTKSVISQCQAASIDS